MSYIIAWFGIWGAVFAAVYVWRGVQRLANRCLEPRPIEESSTVSAAESDPESTRAEQEMQVKAQQRREEARATCEKLFMIHGPEIRERFPREMFDDFVKRYLHDGRPVEEVERRATELCEIIRSHLEKTDGRTLKSLAKLAEWFMHER